MAEQVYKPCEMVSISGVYLVVHQVHRVSHEATLFQGEKFPPCAQCGEQVRFRLVSVASPIAQDSDFKVKPKKARGHSRGHR